MPLYAAVIELAEDANKACYDQLIQYFTNRGESIAVPSQPHGGFIAHVTIDGNITLDENDVQGYARALASGFRQRELQLEALQTGGEAKSGDWTRTLYTKVAANDVLCLALRLKSDRLLNKETPKDYMPHLSAAYNTASESERRAQLDALEASDIEVPTSVTAAKVVLWKIHTLELASVPEYETVASIELEAARTSATHALGRGQAL